MSDQELLRLCQVYGSQAKLWKQKFLGLLPEVERRRLYEHKGCSSIFEFTAKLGGVSREQVLLVLRLDQKFQATPQVQQALQSGSVSISKLSRVASVVTPNNQDFWLNQSRLLSKAGLETLVKDVKTSTSDQPVPGHVSKLNKTIKKREEVPQSDELHLSQELRGRLLALQNKGLDLNKILGELLDKREERIDEEKQRIGYELEQKQTKVKKQGWATDHSSHSNSRYIPVRVRSVLNQEHGTKCAHQNCHYQAANIHHTRRFGLTASHDPLYLAPLCKLHHEIAHTIDVGVLEHKREAINLKG